MKTSDYTEFTVSGTRETFVLECEGKERVMSSKEAEILALKLERLLEYNKDGSDVLISRQLLAGGNDTEMLLIKRETVLKAWYFFKRGLRLA